MAASAIVVAAADAAPAASAETYLFTQLGAGVRVVVKHMKAAIAAAAPLMIYANEFIHYSCPQSTFSRFLFFVSVFVLLLFCCLVVSATGNACARVCVCSLPRSLCVCVQGARAL